MWVTCRYLILFRFLLQTEVTVLTLLGFVGWRMRTWRPPALACLQNPTDPVLQSSLHLAMTWGQRPTTLTVWLTRLNGPRQIISRPEVGERLRSTSGDGTRTPGIPPRNCRMSGEIHFLPFRILRSGNQGRSWTWEQVLNHFKVTGPSLSVFHSYTQHTTHPDLHCSLSVVSLCSDWYIL